LEALGVSDQAIVESFVQRRQQQSAGAAPEDHVKAPADLIDDDVTKSEPNERPHLASVGYVGKEAG
jgi:hypothetical protein